MIDYGLKNRGVEDILIACVDGLNGFPQAIEAVYPKTEIQQCIIHQIRNSTKFVSYKDIKKLIQRATKLLEKQSDTLTSVMKQKLRELEESKNSFFRYEGLKLYLFWGGMVCNILVFLMLASSMFGR